MILYFSGTGNSHLVAMQLASRLGQEIAAMDTIGFLFPISVSEPIIWVMPVHSWGVPKAVSRYIKRVEIAGADNVDHYLVATCGDDCGLIAEMWQKALHRRGWRAKACHSVFMPNTYVTLPGFDVDAPEVAQQKLDAMPEAVGRIAHAIKCGSPISTIHRGRMPWFKTRVLYPLFMRFLTSPKPFRSENCIHCQRCVKACPLANVTMNGDVPSWGERCTLCLGCYHVCPRHCINYGRSTLKKGQWQGAFRLLSGK